jgi:hypothetical protein
MGHLFNEIIVCDAVLSIQFHWKVIPKCGFFVSFHMGYGTQFCGQNSFRLFIAYACSFHKIKLAYLILQAKVQMERLMLILLIHYLAIQLCTLLFISKSLIPINMLLLQPNHEYAI